MTVYFSFKGKVNELDLQDLLGIMRYTGGATPTSAT
jgi:hypothetical protein